MAFSLNKVQLIGNVGKDPDVRFTQDGRPIVTISIATSDSWTDKATGQRQERVEWHKVVIFNKSLAEIAQKHVHKGSKVYVEGALQTRKWTDQQGVERYSTEVVLQQFNGVLGLLDSRGSGEKAEQPAARASAQHDTAKANGYAKEPDQFAGGGWFDDGLPF